MVLSETGAALRWGEVSAPRHHSEDDDGCLLTDSRFSLCARRDARPWVFLDRAGASLVSRAFPGASVRAGGQVWSVCCLKGVSASTRKVMEGAARAGRHFKPDSGLLVSSDHFLPPFLRSSLLSRSRNDDLKGADRLGASSPLSSFSKGAMFSFWSFSGGGRRRSPRPPRSLMTPSLAPTSKESRLRMRSGEGRGEARGDEQRDDDLEESLRMDDRLTGPRLSCCPHSGADHACTGHRTLASPTATDTEERPCVGVCWWAWRGGCGETVGVRVTVRLDEAALEGSEGLEGTRGWLEGVWRKESG